MVSPTCPLFFWLEDPKIDLLAGRVRLSQVPFIPDTAGRCAAAFVGALGHLAPTILAALSHGMRVNSGGVRRVPSINVPSGDGEGRDVFHKTGRLMTQRTIQRIPQTLRPGTPVADRRTLSQKQLTGSTGYSYRRVLSTPRGLAFHRATRAFSDQYAS